MGSCAQSARLSFDGMVSSCASPRVEISDGHIDGNTVTFNCKRGDGVSTIAFKGTLSGDVIAFTWESQLRDGGGAPRAENRLFGPSAPARFTARRVPDGELANAADQVSGSEFAAAVNLVKEDLKVEGTLFLPQTVGGVRAVIVVTSWGLGRAFYEDAQLRRLLVTTDSAVVLARFSNVGPSGIHAANRFFAGARSDGLPNLLQRLAEESGRPEIKDAPLVVWGHSAAGSFASGFAEMYAHRTIAFVGYHSGSAGTGNLKTLNPASRPTAASPVSGRGERGC